MTGGEVDIERLSIRVTGMEAIDARALARAIADGLARPLAIGAGDAALELLAIDLEAKPDESSAELAQRAAAQILAAINGTASLEAVR